MKFQSVFDGTYCLHAGCYWSCSTAQSDRLAKILCRGDFGKFIDQPPGKVAELIFSDVDSEAWSPIVVLGSLIVKTKQL